MAPVNVSGSACDYLLLRLELKCKSKIEHG
jgi:hypothetical protein